MTTFLIILAIYLLSAVALYFVTRFMYLHKHPSTLAPVWTWITPGINTILTLTGLLLCWNYFPITGLEYWKKRWDPTLSPLDKIERDMSMPSALDLKEECYASVDVIARSLDEEVDRLTADWSEKEIAAAGNLISKRKKTIADPDSRV